jgi:microcystin-dependent protein
MAPYVGEIRMFGGNFAPAGWAFCDGQSIPIDQNDTLFNLIGTTYGGDGQTFFNLPDLRGRMPVHMGTFSGTTFTTGENAGVENVTLTTSTIPHHSHPVQATGSGQITIANTSAYPASSTPTNDHVYGPGGSSPANFVPGVIGTSGGNQPHTNIQPYQAVNFIISLFGIFPSQN